MHIDFGVFDHLDRRPDTDLRTTYEDRLRLIEAYDRAGFYAYHLAEHHATPLTMAPSPSVFLAAVAERTKNIRFGPMVYVLPLYHPLRLVEEVCMLDQLSGGRFEFGVGRGITPHELNYYGVDGADSRAIYDEVLEIVLKAFATDRLTHRGPRFTYEDVPINIHPLQKPYPPLWVGVGTLEGAEKAAHAGMHVLTNSPLERSAEFMSTYRDAFDTAHAGKSLPKMAICRHVFVAETDAEAERSIREAYASWYRHFVHLWKAHGGNPVVAAYTEDFDESLAKDLFVFGSPATVRETIERYLDASGTNYFVPRFAYGSLSYEQSRASLDAFTEEVMPHFRA